MSPHKTDEAPAAGGGLKNNPQIFQIFQNVQFNVVQHKKYVKELTKLYKKIDQEEFRTSFAAALHYLFTFGDTSANVDRVVQFVATFCTSLDDEEEFLLFIFDVIFSCQRMSGQSVRYRASQLLAAVLAALGDDASLDDDLCDKLLSSQMERLQDTRGAVRCRAALALQRLQNPMDADDPVTRAYRFHMSCDPNSSVRRAIVQSIAKCARNVSFVLERLCDVDEAVRRAAFIYVSVVNVTQLKVRQRMQTLTVGLTERSPRVRRVVEEVLLPGWLATFKGDIVELLTAVRLDNAEGARDSQHVAGKLLESLFKRLPVSELLEWLPIDKTVRVIPAESLNKETAWYWRHLALHLLRSDDDETLAKVLPDLVVMAEYIRAIVESPCPDRDDDPAGYGTRQHVLHSLAGMLRAYDAGDEAGRAGLQQLLFDVLTGDHGPMNEEVTAEFVSALELVLPDATRRVEFVVSVVSELREPSEPEPAAVAAPAAPAPECSEIKLKRARLRVSLNVAQEAQEEAVLEQNYALAAECKARVERIQRQLEELSPPAAPAPPPPPPQVARERSTDPAVLNRCLLILNLMMDSVQIDTITPLLKLIFSELEEEIFQNAELLENALKTVALYGMLDADFAREHKAFFFANMVDMDNERITCTVLRCVLDLLCVHGARLFEEEPSVSHVSRKRSPDDTDASSIMEQDAESEISMWLTPTHGTVIEVLLKAMDSQCGAYRLVVVEGLCRLLMLSHLESPSILSRFLLLWFSPATEDEDLLRQTIGVFFQSFAVSVDGAQEQIQKATLPTLRALANAPVHSPLSEIDQDAVVRFIVSLTRVQHEMSDSQGSMALMLVSHIVEQRGRPVVGLLCRCLALLQPPRGPQLAGDLASTLRKVLPELPDKTSARNVSRYLGSLEAAERATLAKMSTMATINEISGMTEDNTTGCLGRPTGSLQTGCLGRPTTSLPAPMARSTHIVVNETLEEGDEIDESSPAEGDTTDKRTSKTDKRTSKTVELNLETDKKKSDQRVSNECNSSADMTKPGPSRRHSDSDKAQTVRNSDGRRYSDSDRRVTMVRGSRVPDFDSPVPRLSLDAEKDGAAGAAETRQSGTAEDSSEGSDFSSPRKRAKVAPQGRKKNPPKPAEPKKQTKAKADKGKTPAKATSTVGPVQETEKGIKRTRSQRSIVDLNRGSSSPVSPVNEQTKAKDASTDTPKATRKGMTSETPSSAVRRSARSLKSRSSSDSGSSETSGKSATSSKSNPAKPGKSAPSVKAKASRKLVNTPPTLRKTRSSTGSGRSSDVASSEVEIADSADETELHTIVYDKAMEQSLMSASSDEEGDGSKTKGNLTVPETPESSERSGYSSEESKSPPSKSQKTKAKK